MGVYWLQQTMTNVPAADAWLAAPELVRLAQLHIPKRRAEWRLGRWTGKCALAAYLGIPDQRFEEIEIRPNPTGAPEAFLRGQPAPVAISLTHRDGAAVCAISGDGVLGCDLELLEPRGSAFVADYFTAQEQQSISAASSETDRTRLINLLWSAKESALKAWSTGLRRDTRELVVTLAGGGEEWNALEVCCKDQTIHGWWRDHARFVLTLTALPPPAPPIRLAPATRVASRAR